MGNHQLVIFTQLLQTIPTLHHADGLLHWLAQIFVHRMELEVVHIWTLQGYNSGRTTIELRAMASRQQKVPQQILINTHIAKVAERTLHEHHTLVPQVTEAIFSVQAARLLTKHNLNYWACYYLSSNVLIPPANNEHALDKVNTPLRMLISFFTRQPPNPRLIPTVGQITQQAISLACNHGLLLPENQHLLPAPRPSGRASTLLELIPLRIFKNAANQGQHTQLIPNRQIRRLYLSIDGRRSLAALATLTQLNQRDFMLALRTLITQGQIELYEPNGYPVDHASILETL
ncbi:hypothetical protein KDK_18050 [Dictyobacter kobayashii]|uniref:Uncharacterized protein n=2 Tax=Dictyobacter kobayashii TaxID=2014872 RepID=A0A402AFZ6_9CHLR|nr:hypothetical protein KDK_18050 [Dictyobacter kobayashii]